MNRPPADGVAHCVGFTRIERMAQMFSKHTEMITASAGQGARALPARRMRTALAGAFLAMVALVAGWPATASAATAGQPVRNDALYGVSCTAWTQCMAVGSRAAGAAANFRPLAEWWDGASWRVLPMPGPARLARTQLSEVSCLTSSDCVAVGYHYRSGGQDTADLAEQWNGNSWSIIQSRDPAGASSGFLNDVSCRGSAGCIAIGTSLASSGNSRALAELWSGGRWQLLRVPAPAGARASALNGISCGGAYCMAVGMYKNASGQILTLAERWTGNSWHLLRPANADAPVSVLDDVSCHLATLCMAVGYSFPTQQQPLTELWMNGRWQLVSAGDLADGVLDAISCPGQALCIAVGSVAGQPLSEAWTGGDWRVLRTSRASGQRAGELNHLSCSNQTLRCIAVGTWYEPDQIAGQTTLAESWNGSSWRASPTRNP
jgi:hypothetical protein